MLVDVASNRKYEEIPGHKPCEKVIFYNATFIVGHLSLKSQPTTQPTQILEAIIQTVSELS